MMAVQINFGIVGAVSCKFATIARKHSCARFARFGTFDTKDMRTTSISFCRKGGDKFKKPDTPNHFPQNKDVIFS